MPTRFMALLLAFCAVSLLTIVGNTTARALPTPTAAATTVVVLVDEATAEVTESVTAEATGSVLVGDPVRGEDIFRHGLNGAPPCISCHNPTVAGRRGFSIGPGLKGIGERGATRVEGMTAPEYIADSIHHPTNYILGGYNPIMPPIFGQQYSDQTIADLVAFLMAA